MVEVGIGSFLFIYINPVDLTPLLKTPPLSMHDFIHFKLSILGSIVDPMQS